MLSDVIPSLMCETRREIIDKYTIYDLKSIGGTFLICPSIDGEAGCIFLFCLLQVM